MKNLHYEMGLSKKKLIDRVYYGQTNIIFNQLEHNFYDSVFESLFKPRVFTVDTNANEYDHST